MNHFEHAAWANRVQKIGIVLGVLGIIAAVLGWMQNPEEFFHAYLFSFLFWCGISVGSIAILAISYLTGGYWGLVIRRPAEAAAATIPVVVLLFIPILFGMQRLYEWMHSDVVAHDKVLLLKASYLNFNFFVGRAAIYFIIWFALAYFLRKWGREYEETLAPADAVRLRAISAPGLILLALTITFAAVDWNMSIEPHWYSTMYGVSAMVGFGLSAFAFTVLVASILAEVEPLASFAKPTIFRDLGNLNFAFIMLWAYVSFSEFMLIWYGNIREEVPYFIKRMHGGWGVIASALVIFHFFLPFFMLLMRSIKDRPAVLKTVLVLILFMRLVDYYWLVEPAFHPGHFLLTWLDIALPIGMGGLWLAFFAQRFKRRSLIPTSEPLVQEALIHG